MGATTIGRAEQARGVAARRNHEATLCVANAARRLTPREFITD
jgi:hypothetical protein